MLVKSHIYYCISVLLTGVVYTNQDTIKIFNVLRSYHCVRGMVIYQFTHNIICKSYLQIQVHKITYLTIHITQYSSSYIRLLSSAVRHRLTTYRRLLFAMHWEPEVKLHPKSGVYVTPGMPYIFAGGKSGAPVRMSNNLHSIYNPALVGSRTTTSDK